MTPRRGGLAAARCGSGLLVLLALLAAARGGEAATVPVRAEVILASNQGTGVDERLSKIAKQLAEAFKGYSRYDLVSTHSGDAQVAQPWRAALPGERTLEVTPTAVSEGSYLLQVRVLGPTGQQAMSSNVRLPPGKIVFIGGPPHAPGVLIIALSAQ